MRELRRHERVPFRHSIELVHLERRYHGSLENLSLNGALVQLTAGLGIAVGQFCLLSIDRGGEQPPLQLCCETIHSSASLVGMTFLGCDEEKRTELEQLLVQMTPEARLDDDLERLRGYLAQYRVAR